MKLRSSLQALDFLKASSVAGSSIFLVGMTNVLTGGTEVLVALLTSSLVSALLQLPPPYSILVGGFLKYYYY